MVKRLVSAILGGVLALWCTLGHAQRNLSISSTTQVIEQRVALVIGNSAYKDSPLRNPGNDAVDVAATLRELGWKVVLKTNATQRQMKEAIREFGAELSRGGVGLFYFAGHGIQYRGENYFVPIGASIDREAHVEDETVGARFVLAQMEEARNRVNIVIIDACRNNPYTRGFRSASRGLAQMDAATGTLVAFATAPGSVAADGDGRNGVYTKHLLRQIRQPGIPAELMFKRVRDAVIEETKDQQTPWESSSLRGADFYFRAGPSAPPLSAGPVDPVTIEVTLWDSVKTSTHRADLEEYLRQYPEGRFAVLARNRIEAVSTQLASAAPSVPTANDLQRLAVGSIFRDCQDCPEMVVIPPAFTRVYAVSKFEVTFEQWDVCVRDGGCAHKPEDRGWGRGTRPVMDVNWYDAKQYVAWLSQKSGKGYRLLAETEWEYAARAGTTTAYYWGDGVADICQYASVATGAWGGDQGCGTGKPSAVGEKRPNAFGLHDMAGNLAEWTEDGVLKGGAYTLRPQYSRASNRDIVDKNTRYSWLGIRVARTQ